MKYVSEVSHETKWWLEYMNWGGGKSFLCFIIPLPLSLPVSQSKVLKAGTWKQMFSEKDMPLLCINALVEMDFKVSMSNCQLPERFWDVGQVVLIKRWGAKS